MAEIIANEKPQKGGKKRPRRGRAGVDMTPMVDLMCLLIVFFMLTCAFTKDKVMDMTLPEQLKDENQEAPKISASRTVNILLGPDNQVFYYPGGVSDYNDLPPVTKTDYSENGIRNVLVERNRTLVRNLQDVETQYRRGELKISYDSLENLLSQMKKDDDTGPIVLIKASNESTYGNFVDILDEMNICGIARYTIVNIAWYEEAMINNALGRTTTASN